MEQQPAEAASPRAAPGGGSVAILVVDSDPAVRRVLRLAVEGAGFPCVSCATAEDAAELVEQHEPGLVLTEVRLTGAGGQDLANQLATRQGWHPKVALMSAYPRPSRGAEDYFVAKPIEFERLLHLLESIDREHAR